MKTCHPFENYDGDDADDFLSGWRCVAIYECTWMKTSNVLEAFNNACFDDMNRELVCNDWKDREEYKFLMYALMRRPVLPQDPVKRKINGCGEMSGVCWNNFSLMCT